MQVSPIITQTLNVFQSKAEGDMAVAASLLAKEQQVVKKQAEAIVQLLQDVANSMPAVSMPAVSHSSHVQAVPSRGIDVIA